MAALERNKFMDKRRLQEEAQRYGCEIVHHHYRRKVITLHKGERWTYLLHPESGQPIKLMRDVSVEGWKEAIRIGVQYLDSEAYREVI
jgi:hypothetical protein